MDHVRSAGSPVAFLSGGGALGSRIRAFDWTTTLLGAPRNWPQSLKTLTSVMLGAEQPMFLAWGPDHILLYNDRYAPMLGRKDATALGQPFFEVWSEVRTDLQPLFDRVFAGEPVHMDDISLILDRGEGPGEAHFAFSYTPVRDEDGVVSGLFCPCQETTEQVFAHRRLTAERERQRLLMQQMPGFVAVLSGPDHVYEYVNDAYMRVSGRTEFVGRSVREVFPDLANQGMYERLDKVFATGEPFAARAHPVRLSGEDHSRFLDLVYEPVRDDRSAITGIFIGGYDVSERVRAEQALLASETQFRTFAQAMPNHVWASAPDGQLDWFNQRVYDYGGALPGELDGTGWVNLVHVDDRAVAGERWGAALASGQTYETEFRLRRADGLYRWHLARALPIHGLDGQPTRWIGTNTDIEAQKGTAAALAHLNATLEQQVAERTADRDRVWRNSLDLLVVIDTKGMFRAVSPSVTTILGWQPADLIGRTVFDFVIPDDEISTEGALKHATREKLPTYENRYRHKEGGFRWLAWVAAPEAGLIYATGRNVTAEKAAAAELAQAQDALRQAQKMEAVGQLTGGIAHDFNNMLAVVIGSLDLLKRRIGIDDPRAKRYLDAAADGARRSAILTQRLLAFSRQQPLKPEAIDLNKLVAGMSDLLRHSLGGDVRLETVLSGGLWRTHADPNQVENVILNLAVNGRDAMQGGGRLTIETQNTHLDARYVAAHLGVLAGQYVLLAITDSGTGMPPDVIAKAFDPFFTTKTVGKGTGLGLSQVYGFVRQSGGHVKIYSEPGEGTTVKVYLPRLLGAGAEVIEETSSFALPVGDRHEVVLVVEDEPAVRQFSVDALGELGYVVLEADGAAAALRLLESHPDIGLLFTDVIMPDVNGRKLADAAKLRRPDLKVLFTTGYTRNAVVHNGVLDPGVELIGKPFTIEELAAKVREVLDHPGPAIG